MNFFQIIKDKNVEGLTKHQILTEQEYSSLQRKIGFGKFKALTGAEAIKKLLQEVDLEKVHNGTNLFLPRGSKVLFDQKSHKICLILELASSVQKSLKSMLKKSEQLEYCFSFAKYMIHF